MPSNGVETLARNLKKSASKKKRKAPSSGKSRSNSSSKKKTASTKSSKTRRTSSTSRSSSKSRNGSSSRSASRSASTSRKKTTPSGRKAALPKKKPSSSTKMQGTKGSASKARKTPTARLLTASMQEQLIQLLTKSRTPSKKGSSSSSDEKEGSSSTSSTPRRKVVRYSDLSETRQKEVDKVWYLAVRQPAINVKLCKNAVAANKAATNLVNATSRRLIKLQLRDALLEQIQANPGKEAELRKRYKASKARLQTIAQAFKKDGVHHKENDTRWLQSFKPPTMPTSYTAYAAEHRAAIVAENKDIDFGDIGSKIGTKWKGRTEAEVADWDAKFAVIMAEAEKAQASFNKRVDEYVDSDGEEPLYPFEPGYVPPPPAPKAKKAATSGAPTSAAVAAAPVATA